MFPETLFVLVEGDADLRFFEQVMIPIMSSKHPNIEVRKYAEMKKKVLRGLVKSLPLMKAEYIFVADIDNYPCIRKRKTSILRKYGKVIDPDRIAVVVKEIESWYLCGLDNDYCTTLRSKKSLTRTEHISKEDFITLIPKGVVKPEFIEQLFSKFKLDVGKAKNRSFKHFLDNWCT
jgi:hypothetical protein